MKVAEVVAGKQAPEEPPASLFYRLLLAVAREGSALTGADYRKSPCVREDDRLNPLR